MSRKILDNTKDSHFVPKFLLKNFCDNDTLYKGIINKNAVYLVENLKNECVRRNIYTVKDKISKDDVEIFQHLFLKDFKVPEHYVNTLVAYLNDELGCLFEIIVREYPDVENSFNNFINEINNPELARTQENLFTNVYENGQLQDTLENIKQNADISYFNQNNRDNFMVYFWVKVVAFIHREVLKKITNHYEYKYNSTVNDIGKVPNAKINEFFDLLIYMISQYFRTKKVRDDLDNSLKTFIEGLKTINDKPTNINVENINENNLYFLFIHIQPILIMNVCLNEGYKIVLIENQSNTSFVISDNPCINIYSAFIKDRPVGEDEFELYMPLSSKLAFLFSKKECYNSLPNSKITIYDDTSIDKFNEAVKLNAEKTIYGNSESLVKKYL